MAQNENGAELIAVCHFAGTFGMFGRCPKCRTQTFGLHMGRDTSDSCPACCVSLPQSARNPNCGHIHRSTNGRSTARNGLLEEAIR